MSSRIELPPDDVDGLPHEPTSSARTSPAIPSLLGRNDEREFLRVQRARVEQQGFVVAELLGRPGAGKSSLLRVFAEERAAMGDRVMELAPDSYGGCLSGHVYVTLLGMLVGTTPGLGSSDVERTETLAAALGAAGSGEGRLVVLIDDFDRIDALSRRVVTALVRSPPQSAMLLVVSSGAMALPGAVALREVAPLSREQARFRVAPHVLDAWPALAGFTALELEQLEGYWREGGRAAASLEEVVAERARRTDASARDFLQLLAVLRAPYPSAHLDASSRRAALELQKRGFVRMSSQGAQLAHAWLGGIVRSTLSREESRAKEADALERLTRWGAPLEARAWSAYRAGAVGLGVVLLEQVARASEAAADYPRAVDAYQAMAELCRAETAKSEFDSPKDIETQAVRRGAEALRKSYAPPQVQHDE